MEDELRSREDLVDELVQLRELLVKQEKHIKLLRSSEEKYRTLFNSLDEGFCIIEVVFDGQDRPVDWRCLEVNEQLMSQIGLDNVSGRLITEILPEIEQIWLTFFGDVLKVGVPARLEEKVKGLGRWYDVYAYKTGVDSHQVTAVFRDVTARKQAEDTLRESEQVYRTLLEKSKDGFIIAKIINDEEGNPIDFRVLHANDAAKKITGVSSSGICGLRARDLFLDLDARWLELVSAGQPYYFEYYEERIQQWYETLTFPYVKNTLGIVFRNISGKKKAEEKLRESEERFRKIFNASPIMASIIDLEDESILDVNESWLRVMGYERQGVVGQSGMNLDNALAAASKRQKILEALKPERDMIAKEGHFTTRSGEQRTGLISAQRIDINGRPCVLSQIVDITEGRRVQEAFQKSEERFAKVFKYSPAMIAILRMSDNRVLEANQRFLDVLGFTRNEVIGVKALELGLWTEIKEPLNDLINELLTDGEVPAREYPMRTRSGSMIVVSHTATLIQFGDELCRVAIMQDITREKQLQIEQDQARERFKTFFDNCPTAMIVFWTESREIIDLNPACEKLYKCRKEEMIGKVFEEAGISYLSVHEFTMMRIDLLNHGRARQELDVQLADGSQIKIIISVTRIAGEPEQAMASIIDITDLRRMEAEISRLDRLQLAGEMAASISHEIRNPMTSVRGFLQMLGTKQEYGEDLPFFDLMIEELDRANSIISEYLGMAKDKMVDLQPQSLDPIIRAMLPMLRSDANLREVGIRLDLNDPSEVMVDKYEMRQLIINIAHNGMEAMKQNGTLTIGTFQEADDAVLYIQDEGPGIPEEILDKLDRPFFTTKEKGTGLGLSVCHSIIARHNGRIDIMTGPDGTTFYVRLPVIIS
ncbi:MAG: PAS domain S-box protein [Deltaproteobacteria bacterium]